MAYLILPRRFSQQPTEGEYRIDTTTPLGREIFADITPTGSYRNGAIVNAGTGTTNPPLQGTPQGLGFRTTGTTSDRSIQMDGPSGARDPWTLASRFSSTAYVNGAHLFGWGLLYSSGAIVTSSATAGTGTYRSILTWNSGAGNTYYFWAIGGAEGWDTGVLVDFDGQVHDVVLTYDGTNLLFYRDGKLAASTTKTNLAAVPSGRHAILGNRAAGFTNSITGDLLYGRGWRRALTSEEVASMWSNPNGLYEAPTTQRIYSFTAGGNRTASLSATEAQDTASANVDQNQNASLSATEAQDTAAINVDQSQNASLSATEAQDTAAVTAFTGRLVSLSVTEAQDIAALTVDSGTEVTAKGGDSGPYRKPRRRVHKKKELNKLEELLWEYELPDTLTEQVTGVIDAVASHVSNPTLDSAQDALLVLEEAKQLLGLVKLKVVKDQIRKILQDIEDDIEDDEETFLLLEDD